MQEFEQYTSNILSTENRVRAWIATLAESDTGSFQKVFDIAFRTIPQETRIETEASFPVDSSLKNRALLWYPFCIDVVIDYTEQTEREIASLEELANEENTVAEAVATMDADLAAIMTPPKLGNL